MRILIWYVHSSHQAWTANFVRGGHEYLVPDLEDHPPGVRTVEPAQLRNEPVDAIVFQHKEEIDLAKRWLGRTPGKEIPAVFVEHETPAGDPYRTRHPLAEQDEIPIVHVTHFNSLYWDNGSAPVTVIEHGVADPGHRFSGEVPAGAIVVDEPLRHGRATGTDLLPAFARAVDLDVYGRKVTGLVRALDLARDRVREHESLPRPELLEAIARRRTYVHSTRWTSLDLSLIEAMMLGLPPVVLAATDSVEAVPPGGGVVSTRLDVLTAAAETYVRDSRMAAEQGAIAREHALQRFGLERFHADWDRLLREVTR